MITDYRPLYSIIFLTGFGLFVALLDTFLPRNRPAVLGWLTAIGAAVALGLDFTAPDAPHSVQLLVFDGFSRSFNAVFLVTLIIVSIGSNAVEPRMRFAGEYYALLAFSTIGLMLMASAGGLLALYIGLELSTICLFALVGFAKRERNSAEAALKMFVLGAVASAIILYGASVIYGVMANTAGAAGSTQFDAISATMRQGGGEYSWALWLGLAFVLGGLGFKIAAVPFHLWAPDVYEGAPTTVTAYLSTASKAGGFAAVLRFLVTAFPDASDRWVPMIVVLAACSMVLGNLVALSQTSLKRLLAYSGIAQAGYILVALSAGSDSETARSSALFYLLLYAFTNVGGFLISQAIQDATGSEKITALRGLHKRSPLLAFSMLIVLFSLGGIPPLAGFVGKVYLFAAGWQGGQHGLVIVGALISVVALYYYLMVALQVYIRDPEDDRRMPVARPMSLAIGICVVGTLAIGIYPRPWVDMGNVAAAALSKVSPTTAANVPSNVPRAMPLSN
jgi:NADH-quinone oxidoreductase subunit N